MELCKNCKTEVSLNYCPKCGNPRVLKRIDGAYIVHEIRNVLNFEKGFLFTIKELIISPGKNIHDFLNENRNRLVKPVVFLIVSSLIYSLLNNFFRIEDGYINYAGNEESATHDIFTWVQANYGYANVIMAIFIGLWLKLFFRKSPFNFFEILILLCFVMGMGMLIYSIFGIAEILTNSNLMQVAGIVGFIYTTYAVGQFFDKQKFSSYVKSLIAYLLGMITFSLAAVVTGTVIDLIMQN